MKSVVFHINGGQESAEIERITHVLKKHSKKVFFSSLRECEEKPDEVLAVTDSKEDIRYARENNIAVIAYEQPGKGEHFSGVDMVVEGFGEVDVKFLQLIYMRHHGIPWPITETKRLLLRESVEDDLDAFYKLYSDEGITEFMPGLNPDRTQEEEVFQNYIQYEYYFYNYGLWTVIEKKSGAIIGRAGIENLEIDGKNELEIGYMIGKEWQRQGFATEAVKAIIRFAKEVLEAKRIFAVIHPQNTASIRIVEKEHFHILPQTKKNGLSIWMKEIEQH